MRGTTIANNDKPSVGGSKAVKTTIANIAILLLAFRKSTLNTESLINTVKIIGN